VNLKVDLADFF